MPKALYGNDALIYWLGNMSWILEFKTPFTVLLTEESPHNSPDR